MSARPERIVQVLHNYPPEFLGGVEGYVVGTVRALREQGAEVLVIAGSEILESSPRRVDESFEGVRVARLHCGSGLHLAADPHFAGLLPLYDKVLRDFLPDVVHVHHWWNLGQDLVRRTRALGFPVVLTLHDFFSTCSLFFRMPDSKTLCDAEEGPGACGPCLAPRWGFSEDDLRPSLAIRPRDFRAEIAAASRVLAPSRSHADQLTRFLGMGNPVAITALPLGSRVREPLAAAPGSRKPGFLRLLHFGNLSRIKGIELLADAVERADPSGQRITLTLLGTNVDQEMKTGRAVLLGGYDDATLARVASEHDLAVFPSLARETYGLVVDEALMLGLPVVVSDRGALSERIGGRGIAVPVDDAEALATCLREFLRSPERLDALLAAPRCSVPTPADHATALLEVYAEVMEAPGSQVDPLGVIRSHLGRIGERIADLVPVFQAMGETAGMKESHRLGGERRFTDATTALPTLAAVPRDAGGDLVSVITRTRNRKDLLAEAVRSVADQEHPAREIVVVNDGGEDVGDVLDPFRDRLAIRYLTPGRVGRCRAGNLGLAAARGTFVAWLDDDDLHYPRHLKAAVETLRGTGRKFVYTDAHRIDQERDGAGGPWREVARSVPYSEEFSRVMLFRRAYIHLVTVVFHRECVERLGGFDESLEVLEDWDLFFRIAQDYDFQHVKEVTAAFRIRNDDSNAVTQLRREFADTRTRLFQRYIHVAFPEMLGMLESGREILGDLSVRVARLEGERRE